MPYWMWPYVGMFFMLVIWYIYRRIKIVWMIHRVKNGKGLTSDRIRYDRYRDGF